MLEKIHIYISIFAALIVAIVSVVQSASLLDMLVRLVITIILFYFIGIVFKIYLKNKVFLEPEPIAVDSVDKDNTNLEELIADEELEDDDMSHDYTDK